jgi:hypothetical protein
MKSIRRRICRVLVGLGVLGLIVPAVRADEMMEWAAEQRRQNDEYHRQWQQWREDQDRADRQAQAEREAMDSYHRQWQQWREDADRAYREAQQAQAERDRWNYEQEQQRQAQAQAQADREAYDQYWRDVQAARDADAAWYENQRRQKEWDDWNNNYWWGHWPLGESASTAEPETTATQAPASRSAARSTVHSTAVVILNPFALEKMAPEDRARVRELATQMGQRIIEPQDSNQQIVTNPFVRSPE